MGNTSEEITERRLTRRDALKLAAASTGGFWPFLAALPNCCPQLRGPPRRRPAMEP